MYIVLFCVLHTFVCSFVFFFFKQKTAYEMRISDWSSDVCSSDLEGDRRAVGDRAADDQSRYRRSVDAQEPAVRSVPQAVRERCRGARGEQQRAAARSVADGQGARGRGGVHPLDPERLREARTRDPQEIPRLRGDRKRVVEGKRV